MNHISAAQEIKKMFSDTFMGDGSSSEHDIIVNGIIDFSGSPHNVNKKAYSFKMGKGAQNQYSS